MKVYFEFEDDEKAKLLSYNLDLIKAARKDPNGMSDMMSEIASIVSQMCYIAHSDIYTREDVERTLLFYARQLTHYQEPVNRWIVEDENKYSIHW